MDRAKQDEEKRDGVKRDEENRDGAKLAKVVLNKDVIYTICSFLDTNELRSCACINKEFKEACDYYYIDEFAKKFFYCNGATRQDYSLYLSESLNGVVMGSKDVKERYMLSSDDLNRYGNAQFVNIHFNDDVEINYWIWDVFRIHFKKYGRMVVKV